MKPPIPKQEDNQGRNSKQRPTLRDVAELAQVSPKTASRVLNGERYVSVQVRDKVLAAMSSLNYLPDTHAAGLRRIDKRSETIGVLVGSKANPFSTQIHWSIDAVATQQSYLVLTSALTGDMEQDQNIIMAMLSRRIDALALVTTTTDQSFLLPEMQRGLIVSFIDGPALGIPADSVMSDNYDGAKQATSHLISHGHTHIAYLGANHNVYTVNERRKGFIDAMSGCNLKSDMLVIDDLDEPKSNTEVHKLFSQANPPTAIFAAQNLVARGAIKALRDMSLQHDIALVGFDDTELFEALDPAITVIAQDADLLGKTAANQIFTRLNGNNGESTQIELPTRIITRGSGEIRPKK